MITNHHTLRIMIIMTTYVLVHPNVGEVAKFKYLKINDRNIPSVESFLSLLIPEFKSELIIQSWNDHEVTNIRTIDEIFSNY